MHIAFGHIDISVVSFAMAPAFSKQFILVLITPKSDVSAVYLCDELGIDKVSDFNFTIL